MRSVDNMVDILAGMVMDLCNQYMNEDGRFYMREHFNDDEMDYVCNLPIMKQWIESEERTMKETAKEATGITQGVVRAQAKNNGNLETYVVMYRKEDEKPQKSFCVVDDRDEYFMDYIIDKYDSKGYEVTDIRKAYSGDLINSSQYMWVVVENPEFVNA